MTLYEKIIQMYPDLKDDDFKINIILQNNSDGNGDYIAFWNNLNPQPTQTQLDAFN